jgi:hypothetical protein
MNPLIQLKTATPLFLIALAALELLSGAQGQAPSCRPAPNRAGSEVCRKGKVTKTV